MNVMLGETRVHINCPRGHFIGQTRRYGHRRWKTVTGNCKKAESAMALAVTRMGQAKRARVLFIDGSGWYEPHISMEAHR